MEIPETAANRSGLPHLVVRGVWFVLGVMAVLSADLGFDVVRRGVKEWTAIAHIKAESVSAPGNADEARPAPSRNPVPRVASKPNTRTAPPAPRSAQATAIGEPPAADAPVDAAPPRASGMAEAPQSSAQDSSEQEGGFHYSPEVLSRPPSGVERLLEAVEVLRGDG